MCIVPDKCYQRQSNAVVKSMDSGGNLPVYISVALLLDLLSWANYLTSLCFICPCVKRG